MKNARELTVIKKTMVTPNMLRITLGGEAMKTFPSEQESAYVKLIFEHEKGRLMRTYTIRHQRQSEIDIDFMLHQEAGPASSWAKQTQPNDTILIGGPGPKKMIEQNADYHLLVGDMTALPAISVNLATLPEHAQGCAVIEVVSEEDKQVLPHPTGVEIKWIINPQPGMNNEKLLDAVKALDWLSPQCSVFAACEFNSMKALRTLFKEKGIKKDKLYLSSYWKLGSNEDQHKIIKQQDNA